MYFYQKVSYNENFKDLFTKQKQLKTWYISPLSWLYDDIRAGEKIAVYHLKSFNGAFKKMRLNDIEHGRMIELLKIAGVKYETGNDAPRGGVTGDYIKVYFDGRNAFVKWLKAL